MFWHRYRWACCLLLLAGAPAMCADDLRVAFGEVDISPDVTGEKPVWLAGYGPGRKATGLHDPIMARGLVLSAGGEKFAVVSVDFVGLQYPAVKQIRAALDDFGYVLVASTHNHEGPDVIGIWGESFVHPGVDEEYLKTVVERVAAMVRETEEKLAPAAALYGTAEDKTLLGDSRLPKVIDGLLRVVRFDGADKKPAGLLVQWNCHPEALGSRNTLVTADFPFYVVEKLKERYGCPIVYVSGAIGGLLAPPTDGRIKDESGERMDDGSYEFAERYGAEVAALAARAADSASPIRLAPLRAYSRVVGIPIENPWYRTAWLAGVLRREARVWKGNPYELGGEADLQTLFEKTAIETEVAYLRLGELGVACIPGELYPELVYGEFEDPVQEGVDFPDAPLEKSVAEILPEKKWLLVGLANDEIGYIIPKRQWDFHPPHAYGRSSGQYGEINSCTPLSAPFVMRALADTVSDAAGDAKPGRD